MRKAVPDDYLKNLDHTMLTEAWHNVSVAAVVFDENRTFVAANSAYLDLVGYSRDEINGRKAGANLLADEEGRLAYLDLITQNERLQGSAPIRRKNGQNLMLDYVIVRTHVHEHSFYMALLWRSENEQGITRMSRTR